MRARMSEWKKVATWLAIGALVVAVIGQGISLYTTRSTRFDTFDLDAFQKQRDAATAFITLVDKSSNRLLKLAGDVIQLNASAARALSANPEPSEDRYHAMQSLIKQQGEPLVKDFSEFEGTIEKTRPI